MNIIHKFRVSRPFQPDFKKITLLICSILLLWQVLPSVIYGLDSTAGNIDPSIWLLILLGLITFLLLSTLSWILLKWFWTSLGLPRLSTLFTLFRSLELWQQLSFLWASFALLLLAGAMCLIAIC